MSRPELIRAAFARRRKRATASMRICSAPYARSDAPKLALRPVPWGKGAGGGNFHHRHIVAGHLGQR